jgi:hypothetical protein
MRAWRAAALCVFGGLACTAALQPSGKLVRSTEVADAGAGGAEDASSPPPRPKPFTLVVVPDTQVQVYKWPEDYYAQMTWIRDNVDVLDIRYVIHVGDIVEGCIYGLTPAELEAQWERAKKGTDLIHGRVPYIVTIGNHDFDGWGQPCVSSNTNFAEGITRTNRVATKFNHYYPRSLFSSWPTFGGTFPTDLNDNAYHQFRAGGTDWLIITLKYQPTDAEIAWAGEIAQAHRNHQIIIDTHSYLTGDGSRSTEGDRIWNGLGKLYPNIAFILSGHVSSARRVSIGVAGNTVHEIMSDYQTYSDRERNSWLRLMTFDPVAETVSVRTYSPTLDRDNDSAADDDHFVLSDIVFPQAAPK